MSTTVSVATGGGGGGGVTKIHWGRVGGLGAFTGGVLLFVAGIAVGGEGEYLIEKQRMDRIVAHDHETEFGMQALRRQYDHNLLASTASLRDELKKEKEKEKELEEELQAEHEQAAKLELLSRNDERVAITTTARVDVLGELKSLLLEPEFDAPSHWGAVGPFEITIDIGRPCTISAVTLDWHVSAEPKTYRVSVAMPSSDGSTPVPGSDDWQEGKEYGETEAPEPDMIQPKHIVHEIQIGMF
eukprot:COSAG02_NODE_1053_length_14943_cov_3.871076_8_plen_243_part_00